MIKDIVNYIKTVKEHSLNYIEYGDAYNILNSKEIPYTASIIELENSMVNGSLLSHTFRISVFDRLLQDESNLLDIFDVTRGILNDIIIHIAERYDTDENFTVEYVKDDFADHLAGCYASITINELSNHCSTYENDEVNS